MSKAAPALIASTERSARNGHPLITFPTTGGGSWKVWNRFLALRDDPVFEIGNVCGTCEFWFRRLEADEQPIDLPDLQQRLTDGLQKLDEQVLEAFERLLQSGIYHVALLRLVPERVEPGSSADYFAKDQRATWLDCSAEPRNEPGTPYYRPAERSGVVITPNGDRVFEFIAPLQNPERLDEDRIAYFEERLKNGAIPTAVAVGVLDIKQYYDSATAHWCLTHYLLDGHHKAEAAARLGRPLGLLTFVASEQGTAAPTQVARLMTTYEQVTAA